MPNRLALLVVPLVALALPGEAWGHATLLRTVPADGSVLAAPPATVQVFFDEAVRTSSGIKAVRNGGGSVLGGKPRVAGHRLVVPLQPGLPDGDYTVLWRVLSDDGHTLAGVMAFGVGSGRAPPVPSLTADNGPSVQDVL
ncbi:MAG TPA: copper resistance CopC family protein, partial [Gaiellaceae bacterium]